MVAEDFAGLLASAAGRCAACANAARVHGFGEGSIPSVEEDLVLANRMVALPSGEADCLDRG